MDNTPLYERLSPPVRGLVLDMDGVLYRDDTPLPGMQEFVHLVQRRSIPHLFLTNNSSKQGRQYAEKITRLGLPISRGRVLTSGEATAMHIQSEKPGARVYVVVSNPPPMTKFQSLFLLCPSTVPASCAPQRASQSPKREFQQTTKPV